MSKRLAFFAIAALVCGLVLVYPTMRLLSWVGFKDFQPWLGIALFAAPFLTRVLTESVHNQLSRNLAAFVMTWLGASFCALCLVLPVDILRWAAMAAGLINDPASFSQALAYGLLLAIVTLCTYGIFNAQRLDIRRLNIELAQQHDLGPDQAHLLRGRKIAQISDVHVGSRHPKILRKIVTQLNTIQPDHVVITGDLVDMRGITATDLAPLGELLAPTLFCIGNHERYVDVDDICARLASHGVTVLRNTSVSKEGIQFIGIDDAERRDQVERELEQILPMSDQYKVLLYHRPDGAESAASWGAHLMLTGHTHRGQIFPFNFLVAKVFPRLYQSYAVAGMHLYVSPGTGTWGPVMRLGSKCEITLFELG